MQQSAIHIGNKHLEFLSSTIEENVDACSKIVIITDKTVEKIHLQALVKSIQHRQYYVIAIKAGEKYKSRKVKAMIEDRMLELRCDRNTLLIAFGGGVIGDITGYVAATYMRGIDYLNIPTTLLSMVDSSVGGKVAINTPSGKNLIGAFWQPKAVIIHPNYLRSLPSYQITNGAIEAFKMFITCDSAAYNHLNDHVDELMAINNEVVNDIIKQSIQIKSNITAQDERESELRKVLNFGHTIGHAIEKAQNYKAPHGYCVAYGILVESTIAHQMNILSINDLIRIKNTLSKFHIHPADLKRFDINKVLRYTQLDKKNHNNDTHCVMIDAIGSFHRQNDKVTTPVSQAEISQAWQSLVNQEV